MPFKFNLHHYTKEEERKAKEEERKVKEEEKEKARVAREEEKAAAAAEREKARVAALEEKEQAKLAREKEKEEARVAREAERVKLEAERAAEEAKKLKAKAKQSNAFKSFFAAAAKKSAEPEPALTKPAAPAALGAQAMDAITAAVAAGAATATESQADDVAADAASRWEEMRTRWKANPRCGNGDGISVLAPAAASTAPTADTSAALGGNGSGTRWGDRRTLKRKKEGEQQQHNHHQQQLQDVIDLSMETAGLTAAAAAQPAPKRRKLISVQCSSEYEGNCSYRHGFQLPPEAEVAKGEALKTFPVGGGRPAFWGSGGFPGRNGGGGGGGGASSGAGGMTTTTTTSSANVSKQVTGRRPFARDADTEYETEEGAWIDSGDEWEEEEEGESLSDSDAEADEGVGGVGGGGAGGQGGAAGEEEEQEEGFVVPDGYLSEEEVLVGDDDLVLAVG